jgi:hypothetical protein
MCVSAIAALKRHRRKDGELKGSLGYTVRPSLERKEGREGRRDGGKMLFF